MESSAGMISVRCARPGDFPALVTLLHGNGMFGQNTECLQFYYDVDSKGFFVAEVERDGEKKIIGSAFAMIINDDLAFFNLLGVASEFRGNGIATKLNERRLAYVGERNISGNMLPGGLRTLQRVSNIIQSYDISIYNGVITKYSLNTTEQELSKYRISPVEQVDFDEFLRYDTRIHVIPRENVIRPMLCQKDRVTLVCFQDSTIVGYIQLVKRGIVDIGPIFADNQVVAKVLLEKIIKNVAKDDKVKITTMDENEESTRLVQSIGLNRHVGLKRLYTKRLISLPTGKIYGLTDTGFFLA